MMGAGPAKVVSALRIIQQAPAPKSDAAVASYAYLPLTDAATAQVSTLVSSSWTGGNGIAWQWGMRANLRTINHDNPVSPTITTSAGFIAGTEFDSYAKADAATLTSIGYELCLPAHNGTATGYLDIANAAGIPDSDVYTWAQAKAQADALFTRVQTNGDAVTDRVSMDKIVLLNARLCDAQGNLKHGVLLDWEVADGRSGTTGTGVLLAAASMIKAAGYEAILYLNPLDSSNLTNEGLTPAQFPALVQAFDLFGFVIWGPNRAGDVGKELDAEIAVLPQPVVYRKYMLTVGIGAGAQALTVADGATINTVLKRGFGAVNIWRNFGDPASQSYKDVLAAIVAPVRW